MTLHVVGCSWFASFTFAKNGVLQSAWQNNDVVLLGILFQELLAGSTQGLALFFLLLLDEGADDLLSLSIFDVGVLAFENV